MARITEEQAGSKNMLAFLDLIGYSEGTSTSRWTKDDGYDILVDGVDSPKVFTDYSKHPNILVTVRQERGVPGKLGYRPALKSTAAGRYQFLASTWQYLVKKYNFKGRIIPEAQDLACIKLIAEQGAVDDVHAGRLEEALMKCNDVWASLPGSPYGQPTHTVKKLTEVYLAKGGRLAA